MRGWRTYLLSGFISVVVLELVLQAYYRMTVGAFLFERMAIPIYVADPLRCFAVKPDLEYRHRTGEYDVRYRTDANGFRIADRGEPIRVEKGENRFRVLLLGPSYAFGWANAFEDSYGTLIGRLLKGEGRRVEVLNLGTPGQSVANQLCWVEQQAARYRPDMVVQTVFGWPGNLAGACDRAWCPEVKGGYVLSADASFRKRVVEALKGSAIVFYGWYLTQRLVAGDAGAVDVGMLGPEVVTGRFDEDLVDSYAGYLDLVHRALGDEVQVVFVFIPYAYAVRPDDSSRWGIRDSRVALESRGNASAQIARLVDRGISLVDPTEELVAGDRNERMYYFVDTHLTPAGNWVVASEVVDYIERFVAKF